MDTARRSSSISTTAGLKFPEPRKQVVLGACTYIRLYHGGNGRSLTAVVTLTLTFRQSTLSGQ